MNDVASNVSAFLIHTLFTLYIAAVMLRMLLALVRADFYNPLSQFLVTITNPVLIPLRRVIPSVGRVDTASVLLILVLKMLELTLLAMIAGGALSFPALFIIAVIQLTELLIYIFIFALIVQAVISWVAPAQAYENPAVGILRDLTRPLLQPVRRVLPPIGMVDLSPLAVIIGLYVLLIVLRSLY
ncbi:MAG: YggT family protein [Gammaproteobacteria bacterium]